MTMSQMSQLKEFEKIVSRKLNRGDPTIAYSHIAYRRTDEVEITRKGLAYARPNYSYISLAHLRIL